MPDIGLGIRTSATNKTHKNVYPHRAYILAILFLKTLFSFNALYDLKSS